MARLLKQSTAFTFRIGPFTDFSDGVTEEEAIGTPTVRISKNGAAYANGPALGAHDTDGHYILALTTGNTDTLGTFRVHVQAPATHVPVWEDFMVVPANVYDSLVLGTDTLNADVTQWLGTAVTLSSGTSKPEVDSFSISDSSTAANQVESNIGNLDAAVSAVENDTQDIMDATSLVNSTVSSVFSQTQLDLQTTEASARDDEYNGMFALIEDVSATERRVERRRITDYIATNRRVVLDQAPAFTVVATDKVTIIPLQDVTQELIDYDALVPADLPSNFSLLDIDGSGRVDLGSWIGISPNSLVSGRVDALVGAMQSNTLTATALDNSAVDEIVDGVWDENVVSAHGTADTAGLIISELTKRSVTFSTAAVDGSLIGQMVDDGTAVYDRTTDSLQALRDNQGGGGLTALASGTAQGGTASTIQLAASETFADDELNGNNVKITAGTGTGQSRVIDDYAGASDTATVTPDWITTPDATSVYEVVEGSTNVASIEANAIDAAAIATGAVDADALNSDAIDKIADGVMDEDIVAAHGTADTAGLLLSQLARRSVTFNTDVVDGSIFGQLADDGTAVYDRLTDSQQATRDRGDTAWITGGGGGLTQILNFQPRIPYSIDLANTATVRIGLQLINSLDDLPTTAEITPGTISIDRKAIGGTSYSAVVTDAAMSESAGQVFFDEVFDSATGYAEGDSIRITFKSVSITADSNTHEVADATGMIFQTSIRQTMRGTDSALLAASVPTNFALLDIDGSGRVDLGSWLGQAVTVSGTTSLPEVDTKSVSDDATAADRLEAALTTANGIDMNMAQATPGSPTINTTGEALKAAHQSLPLDAAPGGNGGVPTVDASNRIVGIQGTKNDFDDLNDISAAQVNTEVDTSLNTAIPGSPTADSVNERLKRLEEDITPARATNLDFLDVSVASRSDFDETTDLVTLANTSLTAAKFGTGAIDANALNSDAADEIANALLDLTAGVETGLTVRESLRLIAASGAGKLSGAATSTVVIRNAVADSKNRISATVDTSGNRSAIVYDLS